MENKSTDDLSSEGKAFLDALEEFEKSSERLRQIRAIVRAVAEKMDRPDRWTFRNLDRSGSHIPDKIPYDASDWPEAQEIADAQSRWVTAHRNAVQARLRIPQEEKECLPRVPLLQI